jgi:hypothetical protein
VVTLDEQERPAVLSALPSHLLPATEVPIEVTCFRYAGAGQERQGVPNDTGAQMPALPGEAFATASWTGDGAGSAPGEQYPKADHDHDDSGEDIEQPPGARAGEHGGQQPGAEAEHREPENAGDCGAPAEPPLAAR